MTPEIFLDVLLDAIKDTLELVPFLFPTYLAMEALEHAAGDRTRSLIAKADKSGPVIGALLGALPQCGFSAMAATLYSARVITVGTLVAVILSTSDEMVPVFIAHQVAPVRLGAIMGFKVVVGLVVGLALDAVLRLRHRREEPCIHDLCERAHCGCDDDDSEDAPQPVSAQHGREGSPRSASEPQLTHEHTHHHKGQDSSVWHITRSALVHTLQVTFFIFVIALIFGLILETVGTDAVGVFLAGHPTRATLLAALIGLIPNCGASVTLTELFLEGTLQTGPAMAGLLASGGVGLLVLFRTNKSIAKSAQITAFVYLVSVAAGIAITVLGVTF